MEEMVKHLKCHLECNEERIRLLEFSHGRASAIDTPFSIHNKVIQIQTKTIPSLTLEELAKFVIDGEPIKRIEKIGVEYRKG